MIISTTGWLNLSWIILDLAIVAILIPTILLQRRESGATLAWILVIVFIPFVGLIAFWLLGTTRLHLRRRKRHKVESLLAPEIEKLQTYTEQHTDPERAPQSLIHLARRFDGNGPLAGNQIEIFRSGQLLFNTLQMAIDHATQHIHLDYYIWQADSTGQRIRDALTRAADRGVEVRLLIDDVGSRAVKQLFFHPLQSAGGCIKRFLPVNPLNRQLALNNRNHRKLVIIDGNQAFIGGMNIGDQYAAKAGPWIDLHAHVKGPVVYSIQETFCQDWFHATAEDLVSRDYFPALENIGSVHAQLLSSGPADERWKSIHLFIFSAITLAQQKVFIETPYFVPDQPILLALRTAALRGIDVRLLLPSQSDHPLVLHAGRSFQDQLLEAGVRIFELKNSMTHAKTMTIDGILSAIGSANMDQRSFRLNFESNLFFFNERITQQMEQDFLELCNVADEISLDHRRALPRSIKMIESVCRLLSPLL
ncbi:MAG: cardiolipin synthase [Candidatus Thiodiazotropha sp.]|jgi:cardiolipin synthase A/B